MAGDEKLEILRMVAEGKITPEQGVELLKALSPEGDEARARSGRAERPERSEVSSGDTWEERVKRAQERAEQAARAAAEKAEQLAEEAGKRAEYIGKAVSETVGESLRGIFEGLFRGGVGWFEGIGSPPDEYEFVDAINGEFPPEGEIQVNLRTTNGRIEVAVADQPGYTLEVIKRVRAATEEEAREKCEDIYEFSQEGLILRGKSKDSFAWRTGASCAFRLKLPRGRIASLNLDTANGRIEVSGVEGSRLVADTANGRVDVDTSSFDEASIGTANGRIEYRGESRRLKADTANGRIEARLRGAGDWQFETANGRIEVVVEKAPGVAYEVDASTNMGSITVGGLDDVEVLYDDRGRRWGPKRYHARSAGFDGAAQKATLKASSSVGRIEVSF